MNSGTEVQMAFKPAWAEIEYTHHYTPAFIACLKEILSQGDHSWAKRRIIKVEPGLVNIEEEAKE